MNLEVLSKAEHYQLGQTFYDQEYYDNFFEDYKNLTDKYINEGDHHRVLDLLRASSWYDRSYPHIEDNLEAATRKSTPLTLLLSMAFECMEDNPEYSVDKFVENVQKSKEMTDEEKDQLIDLVTRFGKEVNTTMITTWSYLGISQTGEDKELNLDELWDYTDNYMKVITKSSKNIEGELHETKLIKSEENHIIGELQG